MAESDGYLLDEASIRQLRADHEELWSQVHSPLRRRHINHQGGGGGGGAVEGRLLTAITPASNSLSGATTFTFAKYVKDADNPQTTPATLKEELISGSTTTPNPTTGVNRSTQLSAGVDGYVVCVKVNGEWRPVWCEDVCPE